MQKLIGTITLYCKQHYPNVRDIEVVSHSLINEENAITKSIVRIRLNNKIEFDYISGTPLMNYNHYFIKA